MEKMSWEETELERYGRDLYERTGIESYEMKLERWKEGWRRELEDDLDHGR